MDKMHHVTLHKEKKPWYKRVWLWIAVVIVVMIIIGSAGANNAGQKSDSGNKNSSNSSTNTQPPAKWDVQAIYDKVQNGMTKAQIEELTGKPSENCTKSEVPGVGETEICTYGNAFTDKGMLSVTYMNGQVYTKTKTSY